MTTSATPRGTNSQIALWEKDVSDRFQSFKGKLNKVRDTIQFRSQNVIDGYLIRVEMPHDEAADERTKLLTRTHIPIERISPNQLTDEFIDAISNLTKFKQRANRYVMRWPGIIQTTPDVIEVLRELEAARDAVFDILKTIPNGRSKRQFMAQFEENINLNYLRRKLIFLQGPIDKLAYRWEGLGYVHKKLDVKALEQLLSNMPEQRARIIMEKVAHDPVLYQRFYQTPSVYAQYKYKGQQRWERKRLSLPLITSEPLPKSMEALVPFDNARFGGITSQRDADESIKVRKSRSDMGHYVRVDPETHLYRRKE